MYLHQRGIRSELLPEWLALLSPSPVSGCLGRADADEPVRLVLKVKPFGPGLAPHSRFIFPGVENGKPTHFTVYTKGAGKAPLNVQFSSSLPGDAVKDLDIIDNYDYSHTVKYTPTQQVGFFPSLFPSVLCCVTLGASSVNCSVEGLPCERRAFMPFVLHLSGS